MVRNVSTMALFASRATNNASSVHQGFGCTLSGEFVDLVNALGCMHQESFDCYRCQREPGEPSTVAGSFVANVWSYAIHWPVLDEDIAFDGLLEIVHKPVFRGTGI